MSDREWRVTWRREGMQRAKSKRFALERTARKWVALLTSDEPWVVLGKDPDKVECCSGGYECGCAGVTIRESMEATRANLPKITDLRVDSRTVGAWSPSTTDSAVTESSTTRGD